MRLKFRRIILPLLEQALLELPAPFARTRVGLVPGQKVVFKHEREGVAFFLEIVFKRWDEAFTAEVAWSTRDRFPIYPRVFPPDVNVGQAEGFFSLGLLWGDWGEAWGFRAPPPPVVRSRAEILRAMRDGISMAVAESQAPEIVAAFMQRVRDSLIPFMRRVITAHVTG